MTTYSASDDKTFHDNLAKIVLSVKRHYFVIKSDFRSTSFDQFCTDNQTLLLTSGFSERRENPRQLKIHVKFNADKPNSTKKLSNICLGHSVQIFSQCDINIEFGHLWIFRRNWLIENDSIVRKRAVLPVFYLCPSKMLCQFMKNKFCSVGAESEKDYWKGIDMI